MEAIIQLCCLACMIWRHHNYILDLILSTLVFALPNRPQLRSATTACAACPTNTIIVTFAVWRPRITVFGLDWPHLEQFTTAELRTHVVELSASFAQLVKKTHLFKRWLTDVKIKNSLVNTAHLKKVQYVLMNIISASLLIWAMSDYRPI